MQTAPNGAVCIYGPRIYFIALSLLRLLCVVTGLSSLCLYFAVTALLITFEKSRVVLEGSFLRPSLKAIRWLCPLDGIFFDRSTLYTKSGLNPSARAHSAIATPLALNSLITRSEFSFMSVYSGLIKNHLFSNICDARPECNTLILLVFCRCGFLTKAKNHSVTII